MTISSHAAFWCYLYCRLEWWKKNVSWVQNRASLLHGCVITGVFLTHSMPRFPHLWREDNSTYPTELLRWHKVIYVEHSVQHMLWKHTVNVTKVASLIPYHPCLQPLSLVLLFNTLYSVSNSLRGRQGQENTLHCTPTVWAQRLQAGGPHLLFSIHAKQFTGWVNQVNSLSRKKISHQYLFKFPHKWTIYTGIFTN